MKFTISQDKLQPVLASAARIVPGRSTLPILACLLLDVTGGTLTVTTTDLNRTIIQNVVCTVEEEGKICVPAKLLTDLVSSFPYGDIVIESLKEDKLQVKFGKSKSGLSTLPPGDYPLITVPEGKPLFTVYSTLLQSVIKRVAFAAATDESRPILQSMVFNLGDNKLVLASTDGFRLAYESLLVDTDKTMKLLVPASTVSSFLPEGEINIHATDTVVAFVGENATLISQLIEGNFPDYNQIVPKSFVGETEVVTTELRSALKRAQLFAREASNTTRLKIKPGAIEIYATSAETGNSQNDIGAESTAELEIALNCAYLLEALVGNQTTIHFNTKDTPVMLTSNDFPDWRCVVMPMHIND